MTEIILCTQCRRGLKIIRPIKLTIIDLFTVSYIMYTEWCVIFRFPVIIKRENGKSRWNTLYYNVHTTIAASDFRYDSSAFYMYVL